jgi:hypothetical protein
MFRRLRRIAPHPRPPAANRGTRRIAAAVLCTLAAACQRAPDPPQGSSSPAVPPAARTDVAVANAAVDTSGWLTHADPSRYLSFRYPQELGTRFVHPVDWPPTLQIVDGPLLCAGAGVDFARAGKTERVSIGGRAYCVTRASEGAAGSIYTSYDYAFENERRVFILTFSLRAVQCANYDEPEKSACESERATFDVSPTIDAIARTIERSDTKERTP